MNLLGCAEMWNIHSHKVSLMNVFLLSIFHSPYCLFLSNISKKSLTELWVSYAHAGLMEDPPLQLTPAWSQAIPHCWRAGTYEIIIISLLHQLMADAATTLFFWLCIKRSIFCSALAQVVLSDLHAGLQFLLSIPLTKENNKGSKIHVVLL